MNDGRPATFTPKLPLRARPDAMFDNTGFFIRVGIDCIDVVACKRRYSSRGLEGAVLILLILDAELSAGILGGSLSSPGGYWSFPFSDWRLRLVGHGSRSESSAMECS